MAALTSIFATIGLNGFIRLRLMLFLEPFLCPFFNLVFYFYLFFTWNPFRLINEIA